MPLRSRPLPRHCYEDIDRHGNVRIYVMRHKGGPKTRIRETPGTDAFRQAYDAAIRLDASSGVVVKADAKQGKPGTWRWLCIAYFGSAEFRTQLGARTRYVRRLILEKTFDEPIAPGIAATFADFPVARMTPKAIRVLRDRKAGVPNAANQVVKAIRQVFVWAIETENATANPARDLPYLGVSGEGHHTWTVDEVRQYEARHPVGTKARLALALLAFTGVRRSDVVKLGRQMVHDSWLHFTETKGRDRKSNKPIAKVRELPVLNVLREVIDATPVGNLTFLVTEFGAPFSVAGFGNWFADRCREAGVPGRAHGLRKAGATIAAENGATDRQLMAIFGWETSRQATTYTKKADRRRLAGAAMHMLVPSGR